jgi:hypothetical protein
MNLFYLKKGVLKVEGRQIYGNIEMKNLNILKVPQICILASVLGKT